MITLNGGAGYEVYSCSESLCFCPGRAGNFGKFKISRGSCVQKHMLTRVRNNGLFIAQNFQSSSPARDAK